MTLTRPLLTSSQVIFLYLVLFLPYLRGYIPHVSLTHPSFDLGDFADVEQYPEWQKSARLRLIVPVRVAAIDHATLQTDATH